jgi:glycyl-tRNA synthetase (class II)
LASFIREFLMTEIEHYVDPEKKEHEGFDEGCGLNCPCSTIKRSWLVRLRLDICQ